MLYSNFGSINSVNNPIINNLYVYGTTNFPSPPSGQEFIVTENGDFIITEDGDFIVTEL